MQGCYLLHFEPSYKHAAHYLGWSPEVQARVNAHLHGKGARLTEVAYNAGCTMLLVRVWEDADRKTERKLKNRHGPRLCPICMGSPVQLPLLIWMPAYTPQDGKPELEQDTQDDQPSQTGSLFDIEIDVETQDLIDAREDEEFWRRGSW